MADRERTIAEQLADAEQQREAAEVLGQRYRTQLQSLETEREDQLKAVRREAFAEREQLAVETRRQIDQKRQQWLEAFQHERGALLHGVRDQAAGSALEATRRTLAQLADATLEEKIVGIFVTQLEDLADNVKREVRSHLVRNGDAEVFVHSAFELPEAERQRIRGGIQQQFDYEGDIVFDRAADLIAGVELNVGGYSFQWNVRDFLQNLDLDIQSRQAHITASRGEEHHGTP